MSVPPALLRRIRPLGLAGVSVAFCLLTANIHAQIPGIINYQGRVVVNGTNFTGTGQFQFALVGPGTNLSRTATATAVRGGRESDHVVRAMIQDGGAGYMSAPNVVISGGGGSGATAQALVGGGAVTNIVLDNLGYGYTSDPDVTIDPPPQNWRYDTIWSNGATAVSVPVSKGLYSVLIGDTTIPGMETAVPAVVFTNNDVRLRVWFDGGSGFQQLIPDQRIAAVGYAFIASAVSTGAITGAMLADGAVTGSKLAAGAISSSALAPGVVGTVNLDTSVSNAFVLKSGDTKTGTLTVTGDIHTSGRVGVGVNNPSAPLEVAGPTLLNGVYANLGAGALGLDMLKNSSKMLIGWNYSGGEGEADFIANRGPGNPGGFAFFDLANDGTANRLMSVTGDGKVGIGTANPAAGLHVTSALQWSSWNVGANILVDGTRNNGIGLLDGTSSNAWAIYNGAGMFHIAQMPQPGDVSTAPNRALVIATNANVGIGTATPREKLEVAGRILLNGPNGNLDGVDVSGLAGSGKLLLGGNKTGGGGETDFIQNRGASASEGGYGFYDLANDGTLNLLMRVKGDGKVGIGTPAPVEQLDVAGAIKLANTANPTPAAGTIRWTGIDFQGYDGARWTSLTMPAPAGMVLVLGGTFMMGSTVATNSYSYDASNMVPVHLVTLSPFYLSKYEATYGLWYNVRQWATNNGYRFDKPGCQGGVGTPGVVPSEDASRPVTDIGWRECMVWCNAYSELQGLTPVYTYTNAVIRDASYGNRTACDNAVFNRDRNGYRLPTEAEWEYSARYIDGHVQTPGNYASGAGGPFADTNATSEVAWYWPNSSGSDGSGTYGTHPVGTKRPNQLGIYDMSGNVTEWCWDWYGSYSGCSATNPPGPSTGSRRVIRFGSWGMSPEGIQCAFRWAASPDWDNRDCGFRIARNAQ